MQTPAPGADVKTRILQAALGVLAEHGAAELTQPKVARAAGVRQSHLTYYFPTRADLLLAVAEHSVGSLMAALTHGAQAGASRSPGWVSSWPRPSSTSGAPASCSG